MAEVALAVVLVVGAGLLLRSFQKLMTVDPGFNRERMLTFGVVLPGAAYPKPEQRSRSSINWATACGSCPACRAWPG